MTQNITLKLPDKLYEPIRRMARATNQPVEKLVLAALQASLPSLEGLTADLIQELVALESLDDDTLWQVMLETVPPAQQRELNELLQRNQAATLGESERARLDELQRAAERVMLRKARAAVLLRFRGRRIPTLTELRQLTTSNS